MDGDARMTVADEQEMDRDVTRELFNVMIWRTQRGKWNSASNHHADERRTYFYSCWYPGPTASWRHYPHIIQLYFAYK
jgi:hypothetical protein